MNPLNDDDRKQVDAYPLDRELPDGERRGRWIALNTFRELRAEGWICVGFAGGTRYSAGV